MNKKGCNFKLLAVCFIGILLLALTMISALAVPMPHPVFGKVKVLDDPMLFEEVKLSVCDWRQSDLNHCDAILTVATETDGSGSFVFELANVYPDWRPGELVEIQACTGSPACKRILEIDGTFTELNFNIGSDSTQPNVQVVEPSEGISEEDIKLIIAGVETSLERLRTGKEELPWWKGFVFGIIGFLVGIGSILAGRKRLATVLKKHNRRAYKK